MRKLPGLALFLVRARVQTHTHGALARTHADPGESGPTLRWTTLGGCSFQSSIRDAFAPPLCAFNHNTHSFTLLFCRHLSFSSWTLHRTLSTPQHPGGNNLQTEPKSFFRARSQTGPKLQNRGTVELPGPAGSFCGAIMTFIVGV